MPRFCYHPRMTPVGMCRQCLVEVEGPRGPMLVVIVHDPGRRGTGRPHRDRQRQARPGGRARAAARQPPARLPGVRQGRRVPAAGPGVQPRSRREPVRRGEAPLREADPDQRPRVPRPRALHPVRPLHALRRRGRRRQADPLHQPRQPDPGATRSPTSRSRATSPATPCRSARSARSPPRRTGSRPGRGTSSRSRARARRARSAAASSVQSSRDELLRYQGVDSDPVNWGWLCDRGRFDFEAVNCAERLGAPLVRGETGLVETSWNARAGDRRGSSIREALDAGGPDSDRAARRRARHERGRVRVGPARRRASASTQRDAQLGDGLPRRGARAADGRRSTRPPTRRRSCSSAPTSRRSCRCCTCGCATPPRSARSRILEFTPTRRAHEVRVEERRATSPGAQPRVVGATLAEPDDRRAARRRARRRRRRARQPRRVAGATVEALQPLLDAVPAPRCCPALRRGNVVGALQLGLAPARRRARRRRWHRCGPPPRAGSTAGAARSRSARRLPRRRPRPPRARRRAPDHRRSTRSSPTRSRSADVVLAAAAYGEKSARRPTSRAG